MKKAAIVVVSGLILMVAFAFLIYPTPYRYMEFTRDGTTFPVKHNVITDKTQIFTTNNGWMEIKNQNIQAQ